MLYLNFPWQKTKPAIIDKIYIINLDKSPQRYKEMQDKLKSVDFPVPITRFSAIDGRKITFTNSSTQEIFTGEEILAKKIY